MDLYVAFLRGVNLGRNRRVKNADLKAVFEGMGFEEVAPFRTSGNVVFGSKMKSTEAALVRKLEAGLGEAFGFEVKVLLRSADEVVAIAAHEPFAAATVEKSKGKLQVSLLAKKPSAAAQRKVLALATNADLLVIEGRELYWLPAGGTLESDLDLKAIADAFGLDTRRTMGTIEQIAAKYCG